MYPVEFIGRQAANPREYIRSLGEVEWKPNPLHGGRRIVEVPTRQDVETLLKKNPPGEPMWVEPGDILTRAERERVIGLIDRFATRLQEANPKLVIPTDWAELTLAELEAYDRAQAEELRKADARKKAETARATAREKTEAAAKVTAEAEKRAAEAKAAEDAARKAEAALGEPLDEEELLLSDPVEDDGTETPEKNELAGDPSLREQTEAAPPAAPAPKGGPAPPAQEADEGLEADAEPAADAKETEKARARAKRSAKK